MPKNMNIAEMLQRLEKARVAYKHAEVSGKRRMIPRENAAELDTIFYYPRGKQAGPLPVLVEAHGGAWLAGDAVLMDSFCRLLADSLPALVVNLNYKKIDQEPFPYQQEEVRDLVEYLNKDAEDLGIDPARISLCGQSAGAHICAGAAILIKERGLALNSQILVYPFTDFLLELEEPRDPALKELVEVIQREFLDGVDLADPILSPARAGMDQLAGAAPAAFVVCGRDPLRPHALRYAEALQRAGVSVQVKEYEKAEHGFLEVCRPEQKDSPINTEEQSRLARDCEQFIIAALQQYFS